MANVEWWHYWNIFNDELNVVENDIIKEKTIKDWIIGESREH